MSIPDHHRPASCPRCGYDLRGAMEQWRESCPIFGICSECGLSFEWADLLSTKRVRPRWNVEFPRRLIYFPLNVPRTLACSFWPWKFFSSLKMHHEFRPLRIAAYLIVLFCLPYVIFVARLGHDAWTQYGYSKKISGATMNVSPVYVVAQAVILPFSSQPPGTMTQAATNNQLRVMRLRGMAFPPTVGGIPSYIYPLASPAELVGRRYRFKSDISFWEICPDLMLFGVNRWGWGIDWKLILGFLLIATVFSGLCPLGFVLLPHSRRTAKVRREHLIRITLYSFVFLAAIMAWIMFCLAIGRNSTVPSMQVRIVCLFLLPLVHLVWWSVATGRYLKMPHAWGVGASVVVIAYLLSPMLLMCVLIFLATFFT